METQFPKKQILNEDGVVVDDAYKSMLDESLVKTLYTKMLRARLFDRKGVNLQRQGRIGTYVPFEGQEAAQIGSSMAMEEGDWMFPTYRDHGATLTFGHSLKNVLLYWKGRQEGCIPPEGIKIFPPAVPIASQLLHATGAAWAEKMKGTDRASIVYFGDGATSEGDFHEGLNFASVFNIPVVFFNQNNGFAISVPVEKQMKSKTIAQKAVGYDIEGIRLDGNDVFAVYFHTKTAVEKARAGGGPTLIEAVTWRYGAHTTADDPSKYRDQNESSIRRETTDPLARLEKFMQQEGIWEPSWQKELEQDITLEIEAAVNEMENEQPPHLNDMFDHVFAENPWPIEDQKEAYAHVRGNSMATAAVGTKKLTLVQAVTDGLRTMMRESENVIVLGEDVGRNGGVFRATDGLMEEFGDQRIIDTPLAESGIIGTSIGLAMNGFRPVAEMQFLGFVYPAFNQIMTHASRIRSRTLGAFTVPMVIRAPFGAGVRAPEIHSDSVEALFTHMPGIKVVVPSNPYDAKGLLIASIEDPDPVLFLEPMRCYRSSKMDVPDSKYTVEIGKGRVMKEGEQVTILTYGAMVDASLKAANEAESKGISVEVIDLRTLYPLDKELIAQSVQKTGRTVIVHEAPSTGGLGDTLISLINDTSFLYMKAPIERVTGFDTPVPMFALEDHYLPNAARITSAIHKVINF